MTNDGFAELKVHLIHWKQVLLLQNTVLILCDEGDGLVAVIRFARKVQKYGDAFSKSSIFTTLGWFSRYFELNQT